MGAGSEESLTRTANARNNAQFQGVRLDRWRSVRDSVWRIVDPCLHPGARVAIVGAGSCDDIPLRRIAARAGSIDLVDLDATSLARARTRAEGASDRGAVVTELVTDVTEGAADAILNALRSGNDPELPPRVAARAIGDGDYDLVVGDMLYTQLLHPGLIALDITGEAQRALMRTFDPPLVDALVRRLQRSLSPTGRTLHIHDVACWTAAHPQPMPLAEVLVNPDEHWRRLRRHDACDPHLVLQRLGARIETVTWWEWPFEPNKQFLVRATLARPGVGGASPAADLLGRRLA